MIMTRHRAIRPAIGILSLILLSMTWGSDLRVSKAQVTKATTPQANDGAKYTPRYHTIAHRILELESEATKVDDSMFQLLDSFIDEAKARIPQTPMSEDREERKRQAGLILQTIDDILIRHNVIYPRNRKEDWTLLLSDGLTPKTISPPDLDIILRQEHNLRRVDRIDRSKPFYLLDCDTASYVYVAIGEALGLPLAMVDLPEHNFIRWSFTPESYVNWETMYGRFRSNTEYRELFFSDDDLAEELYNKRVYLVAMTPQDVMGYCYAARGIKWEKPELKKYGRAIEDYEASIKMYPRSPFAYNNLAWLLATCPDAKIRDGKKAIGLALQAVRIHPGEWNYVDTLAASYAEDGQFEEAGKVEQKAYDMTNNPLYRVLARVYGVDHHTYAQYAAEKERRDLLQKNATRN